MSRQVNVRLSEFHVELLQAMKDVHAEIGVNISQAKLIESALELWLQAEPNMKKAVSGKMDLGIFK